MILDDFDEVLQSRLQFECGVKMACAVRRANTVSLNTIKILIQS